MLQHYLSYGERLRDDLEHSIYSKFQCPDRRSSASSTASTASFESNRSGSRNKLVFSQMSRQSLANTFQKNWTERCPNEPGFDDSLTNLNWLHNVNPIKINEQLSTVNFGYPRDKFVSNNYQPRNHYTLNYPPQLSTINSDSNIFLHSSENNPFDEPDYKNNPNLKPPFSYAILITWAMKELGKPKITLSDIYGWIVDNFAYYRYSDPTWQNSVRHNLSSGKCFEKVPRRKDEPGKGGFWRIKHEYLKTLDMNLSKIKYNPFGHTSVSLKTEKISASSQVTHVSNINSAQNNSTVNNVPTPVKRSRKSPIRTTPENWDSINCFEKPFIHQTNNFKINQNQSHNEEMILLDDKSVFSSGIDFSSIDNSSCDSYQYLSQCPSNDNDISMNSFDDDSLSDILASPMLLEKEEILDNEDFKSLYSNDFDLFRNPKDDLEELENVLGIYS